MTKIKAISQILDTNNDYKKVLGYISLVEDTNDNSTHITISLKGLVPGKHAIHIHEKGDPTKCCDSLGSHYNPFGKNHGNISDDVNNRHVGDLGNILVDINGNCLISMTDKLVKLSGPYSVIGRSFVIHENIDDLGKTTHKDSKTTGNSGKRIAYGIIGIA